MAGQGSQVDPLRRFSRPGLGSAEIGLASYGTSAWSEETRLRWRGAGLRLGAHSSLGLTRVGASPSVPLIPIQLAARRCRQDFGQNVAIRERRPIFAGDESKQDAGESRFVAVRANMREPLSASSPAADPLSGPQWDSRLGGCDGYSFFHSSAWIQVLHRSYGFAPVWIEAGDRGGAKPSGLLLMDVRSPITGRRGIGLPFTDVCPPLGLRGEALADSWLKAREEGARRKWKYLELRGVPLSEDNFPASVVYYGHRLDLTQTEHALLRGMESSFRRGIAKAEKAGIAVELVGNRAAMHDYYRLHCLTRQRHGLPPQPWTFFAQIAEQVVEKGLGFVGLARSEGRAVAGAVFLHTGRDVIYKFGASDFACQALRPNNLLFWHAIRNCAQRGFQTLDFGRTSVSNEGLRRFKLGLGTSENTIKYVRYNLLDGRFEETVDRATGWVNQLFRCLPLPLLRLAGQLLYRHVD